MLQKGRQETELGIRNPAYDGHVIVDNTDLSENRDKAITDGRRISVNRDEEKDSVKDVDKTENEFKSLVPFCLVIGIGTLFSQSVTAYLASQVTVLERAFGLSSSTTGFLLSANDIGFVVTVLLASHFLKNRHIPRVLALCIFTFGVSGILTSLPHFIVDEREQTSDVSLANSSTRVEYLCVPGLQSNLSETEKCAQQTGKETAGNTWVVAFIAVMMAIQGVAKAPRVPLSTLYIDNNSNKEKTGFYIGLLMSFSVFGPFIAITAGGLFNTLPVDLRDTNLTPDDPRWISAWWLGFIVFGACALLISFPIFCFPVSLRRANDTTHTLNSENANSSVKVSAFASIDTVKDLPKSVIRVFRQPVYACNLLSQFCFVFGFMALASFGPKYIENQFRIPTWKANTLLGIEKLVTAVSGTFAGGVITRKFRLGLLGCVKMILLCRLIAFVTQPLNFLWGCDTPPIVGYSADPSQHASPLCDCSMTQFLPVCADGRTYFSPCHAGCTVETNGEYSNCTAAHTDEPLTGAVTPGICDDECTYFLPFVVLNAVGSFLATMSISPSYVTNLRSVSEEDRAMAVGLESFVMALLVFLPAPIVYGGMFDSLCILWKSTCSGIGSCLLYDIPGMRYRLNAINVGLIALSLLVTCATCLFARRKELRERKCQLKSLQAKVLGPPEPSVTT